MLSRSAREIWHPIYASLSLFAMACAWSHPTWVAWGLAGLVLVTTFPRMLAEERLLVTRYPEYRDCARTTKSMLPYVF